MNSGKLLVIFGVSMLLIVLYFEIWVVVDGSHKVEQKGYEFRIRYQVEYLIPGHMGWKTTRCESYFFDGSSYDCTYNSYEQAHAIITKRDERKRNDELGWREIKPNEEKP